MQRDKAEPVQIEFLDPQAACRLTLGGELWGYLGVVSKAGRKAIGLRHDSTIAELKMSVLTQFCQLVPQFQSLSPYPAIDFDFNFIVAERVRWDALAGTVQQASGALLERITYQETYRDAEKDGKDRKRLLFSVRLRSGEQTLTGEQAESIHQAIIAACRTQHEAELLG